MPFPVNVSVPLPTLISPPLPVILPLTVSDADSPQLAGAVVVITTNYDAAHDTLAYSAPAGNPVTARKIQMTARLRF